MELVTQIYEITEQFPAKEQFSLVSQMRRSAVSIPSNIAEGSRRKTKADTAHFLSMAFASGAELETQIEIVKRLSFGADIDFSRVDILLEETMKMLNVMIYKK